MADRCKQSRPYGWVGGVYIGYSPERITVKSQGASVDYVPERETCRNVADFDSESFKCSRCGCRVLSINGGLDGVKIASPEGGVYNWGFCPNPNCGAEVVEP